MFFKNLKKKRIPKYKSYFHRHIIQQLRPTFKFKTFLRSKTRTLNTLLYRLKRAIAKKRVLKARKRVYKLNIIFFKKTKRRPVLLSGLFQKFIRKHTLSKKYKQNRKKTIFKITRYKLKLPKTLYLSQIIKLGVLKLITWKSRYNKQSTKLVTHWKTIRRYIFKKYRRHRIKKLRVRKTTRKFFKKRHIIVDRRTNGWAKKLTIFSKFAINSRLHKVSLCTLFSKKVKKYKGDYRIGVHRRKQFLIIKRKISLKKLKSARQWRKLSKYVSLTYTKRDNSKTVSSTNYLSKLLFLPIKSFKNYRQLRKKFPTNINNLLKTYYDKLKKLQKTTLGHLLQKRKYTKQRPRHIHVKLTTILHKRRNRTNRYVRHLLKILRKKPLTQKTRIFRKQVRQNKRIKRYKFFLKKLNKLKFSYSTKQLLYINFLNLPLKRIQQKNKILDKSFITKKLYKKYTIDFYRSNAENLKQNLKKKKTKFKKSKRVYAFNFWKKKLTVLKNARQIHWDMYTKKTLKKRRYRLFLANQLKKKQNISTCLIQYFSIKFKFSNSFWETFRKLYLNLFHENLKKKKIYQFPIHNLFWKFLYYQQNRKKKIRLKIKNWIRKNKRIKRRFWMSTKKNTPKYFYQQTACSHKTLNSIHYDYLTNYFCVIKQVSSQKSLFDIANRNNMLKLHNIRYKA